MIIKIITTCLLTGCISFVVAWMVAGATKGHPTKGENAIGAFMCISLLSFFIAIVCIFIVIWSFDRKDSVQATTKPSVGTITDLSIYRTGYNDAFEKFVDCAADEIIYKHPTGVDCIDFFLSRQKAVADYEDSHK